MQKGSYEIQIELPDYLFSQGKIRGRIKEADTFSKITLKDKTVTISCKDINQQNNTDPNKFVAGKLFDKVFKNFTQEDIINTFNDLNQQQKSVKIERVVAAACYGAWIIEINEKLSKGKKKKDNNNNNTINNTIETYLGNPILRGKQDSRTQTKPGNGTASTVKLKQLCPTIKMIKKGEKNPTDINMKPLSKLLLSKSDGKIRTTLTQFFTDSKSQTNINVIRGQARRLLTAQAQRQARNQHSSGDKKKDEGGNEGGQPFQDVDGNVGEEKKTAVKANEEGGPFKQPGQGGNQGGNQGGGAGGGEDNNKKTEKNKETKKAKSGDEEEDDEEEQKSEDGDEQQEDALDINDILLEIKKDTMDIQKELQDLLNLLNQKPEQTLGQENLTRVKKLANSAADAALLEALERELIKKKSGKDKNFSIKQRAAYIAKCLRAEEIIIQLKQIIEEEQKSLNLLEPLNSSILPSQKKNTLLEELSTKLGLKKINDDDLTEVEKKVKKKLKPFQKIVDAANKNPKVVAFKDIYDRANTFDDSTTNEQAIGILQEIKQREFYVDIQDSQYIINPKYDWFNDKNLHGYKARMELLNKYKPEQKKVDTKLVDESYFDLSDKERKEFLGQLQKLIDNPQTDIKSEFTAVSQKMSSKFNKIINNPDTFVGQKWSEANTKVTAIASTTAGNNTNTTSEVVTDIKKLVREIKEELEKDNIKNAIENATVLQKHRTTQLKLEVKLKEINRNKEIEQKIEKKGLTKPAEVGKQLEMKAPDLFDRAVEFSFEEGEEIYIKFKKNKDNKCGKFKKVTIGENTDCYVDNDGCVFKITDGKVKYQTIEETYAFKYKPEDIEDRKGVSIATIEKRRKNPQPKESQPALKDAKDGEFVLMYKKSPDNIFNILGNPVDMPIGYERFGKPFVQKNDSTALLAFVPNDQDIDLGAINGYQRLIKINDNKLNFEDNNNDVTIESMVFHQGNDIEQADKHAMLQPSTDLGLSRQYVDTVVKSESLKKWAKIFGFGATAVVIAASFAAYEILKYDIIIKDIIAKAGINFDSLSSEIKQKLLNVDITETGILGKKIRNILNDGTLTDTNALDKNDIAGKLKNLTDSNIADTISKYQDLLIAAVIVFAVLLAIAGFLGVASKKSGIHLMRDNQELTQDTIEKITDNKQHSKFNSLNGVHLPRFAAFLEGTLSEENLKDLDNKDFVQDKYQYICDLYYKEYTQKELDTVPILDCDKDVGPIEALKRFDPFYAKFLDTPTTPPTPTPTPNPTDWASATKVYKTWKIAEMKKELARIDKEHKLLAAMEYSWLDSKNGKTDFWAKVGHVIGKYPGIIAAGFTAIFTIGLGLSIAAPNTEGIIACSVMLALFALFYIAVTTTLNKGKDLKDVNGVDKVTTFLGRGINKYWYVGLLGLSSILSIAGFLRFGSVPLPSNTLLVVAGALMAFCILFKIAQSVYQRYKTTKEIIDICKTQNYLESQRLVYRAGVYVGAFFGELPEKKPNDTFAPVPIRGVLLTLAAGATASLAAAVAIKEAMGEPLFGLSPISTMALFFGLLAIAFICNEIDKKYTSAEINKAYGIKEKNTLIHKTEDSSIVGPVLGSDTFGNVLTALNFPSVKSFLNPIKNSTANKAASERIRKRVDNIRRGGC